MASPRRESPAVSLIDSGSAQLSGLFESYSSAEGLSLTTDFEVVLKETLELLGLSQENFPVLVSSFLNLVNATCPGQEFLSFTEFSGLLKAWVSLNSVLPLAEKQAQELLLHELDKSIQQYKALLKHSKDPLELAQINELLEFLQKHKATLLRATRPSQVNFSFREEPSPQEVRGVEEIFNFYSKQQLMIRKAPTFAEIGGIVDAVDMGSFLYFCRSFSLISDKGRSLSKQEAIDIFKECAQLRKRMGFTDFVQALDALALAYFNNDYEHISCQHFSLAQKRVMLYESLRCADAKQLARRLKPLRGAFFNSLDRKSRISPTELKRSHKHKPKEPVRTHYKEEPKQEPPQKKPKNKAPPKPKPEIISIQDIETMNFIENRELEDLIM